MYLNNWTLKRSFKKVFCLNVCNKEPWVKIIKLFDKKGGDIKIFTFRDPHRIFQRTSRSQEVINFIPWGICGVRKVWDLGERVFLLPFLGLLNMTFLGKVDFCNIYVFIYHLFKIQRHDWNSIHVGSNFTVARVANLIQIYDKLHSLGNLGSWKKIRNLRYNNGILGAPCANSRIHLIRRIVLLFCNPEAFALVLFAWFFLYVSVSFCKPFMYTDGACTFDLVFFIESLLTIPQKWF